MNAALVHAVIAGGVHDPRRLAEWAADPQALRVLGLDPASLDLQALRHFSGLALKVRHNGLRDSYPQSFRLLDVAGLEIEVFADYALAHATTQAPLAASNEARAQALVDFIQRWHDPRRATHALLWDLLRHEQALAQLVHTGAATAEPPFPLQSRPTAASVPHVRGAVRLHELQHDPRATVAALRQRTPDLASLLPATCALCYWRPPGEAAVGLVELDAFGYAVLQAANGQHSVADIAAALGLGRRVSAPVLRLLTQLQQTGLLVYAARVPAAAHGAAA